MIEKVEATLASFKPIDLMGDYYETDRVLLKQAMRLYISNKKVLKDLNCGCPLRDRLIKQQRRVQELYMYAYWRVIRHTSFQKYIAYHELEPEDLLSIATEALFETMDKFQENYVGKNGKVASFSTFYFLKVRIYLMAALAEHVGVDANTYDKLSRIRSAYNKIKKEKKRQPTDEEISVNLTYSIETVSELREKFKKWFFKKSVDEVRWELPPASTPKEILEDEDIARLLNFLQEGLPEREYDVLIMRHIEDKSIVDIAKEMKLSRERVRILYNRALAKARDKLALDF